MPVQSTNPGDVIKASDLSEYAKASRQLLSVKGGNGIVVRNAGSAVTISLSNPPTPGFWGKVVRKGPKVGDYSSTGDTISLLAYVRFSVRSRLLKP